MACTFIDITHMVEQSPAVEIDGIRDNESSCLSGLLGGYRQWIVSNRRDGDLPLLNGNFGIHSTRSIDKPDPAGGRRSSERAAQADRRPSGDPAGFDPARQYEEIDGGRGSCAACYAWALPPTSIDYGPDRFRCRQNLRPVGASRRICETLE